MLFLIKAKELLLDALFPPLCAGCGENLDECSKEKGVCGKCLEKIRVHSSFFCPECKARMPGMEKFCHKNSKYILAAVSDYGEPAIKNSIWHFKYKKWKRMRIVLGELLNRYLENLNADLSGFAILPIPLHPKRLKERGFNQSRILAEIAAEKIKADLITDCLIRNKNTSTQAELKNYETRMANVSNCFAVENPEKIKNRDVIIIDDVFTSGATINEAVKILKSRGAKKIIALVIAKA